MPMRDWYLTENVANKEKRVTGMEFNGLSWIGWMAVLIVACRVIFASRCQSIELWRDIGIS
jgi:hypothetical protein